MVKQDIILKGLELFAEFGYKATRVDEISSQLGISKKTFYKHFSSKEDFIVEVIEYQTVFFKQLAEQWSAKTKDVIDYFIGFLRYCDELSGFVSNFRNEDDIYNYYKSSIPEYESLVRKMLGEFILSVIERGKSEGLIDKEVNDNAFVGIYVNHHPHLRTCDDFNNYNMKDILNQSYYLFLKGLLNSKGVQLLESKEYSLMIAP